ncbi:hypothetical protein HYV85_01735 [Candidatus Woesearchaeota archaeon]|nr:hypothetical protein [Candidatus Woesearchaeota archaeon]
MSLIEQLYKPVKDEFIRSGLEGIAVDIDDTISATNAHWVRTLVSLLKNPEGLSPEDIISKYRYAKNVPYWASDDVEAYVQGQFLNEVNLMNYPVVDGALKGVRNLDQLIRVIAYITTRPERVARITSDWLTRQSFPPAKVIGIPKTELLKQGSIESRGQWKAAVLEYLYPQVMGIVDDNEDVLEHLSPTYKGKAYIFSEKALQLQYHFSTVLCPSWEHVVDEVRQTQTTIRPTT